MGDSGASGHQRASSPKRAAFHANLITADRDHDAFATGDELIAELRARADRNHDGAVTQEEIERAMQSGALSKDEEHR